MKKIIKIILCYLFISQIIIAQGPPIFTDSPILLGLEGGGIRTFGKFISSESGNIYAQSLVIPYNLTTDLQIGGMQPFVIQSLDNGENKLGFGNFSIFSKYSIIQIDAMAKTFRALLKFTQSFPTGAEEVSPANYVSQLAIVTGYVTTKYGIYGTVGYNFVSNNLSNNFIYNFAFGYPLLPQRYPPFQLNLFIELNGSHILDQKKHFLLVSPGFQLVTSSTFLVESGFQIPIIDDRNTINIVYTLGIRHLFF